MSGMENEDSVTIVDLKPPSCKFDIVKDLWNHLNGPSNLFIKHFSESWHGLWTIHVRIVMSKVPPVIIQYNNYIMKTLKYI